MADRDARTPVQLVGIKQPRCGLRFGVAPCTATTDDGPRCYNCWGTCLDLVNYDPTGSIEWMFYKPNQKVYRTFSAVGEDIRTNPMPLLESVTDFTSKINVGSVRDGEAPLGVTGGASAKFNDQYFDDRVGDYYYADRTQPIEGDFFAKFVTRNPFYGNMTMTIYEGTADQLFGDLSTRTFLMENVDGPNIDGSVKAEALDPLRLTDPKRSLFPRATDMRLGGAIDNSQTAGIILEAPFEVDVSDAFGNTVESYVRIGSEIVSYTGYTGADGVWELTGVTRAVLGTAAASHSDNDAAQRVGRFAAMDAWDIAKYLIADATDIGLDKIPEAEWDTEAGLFLTGYTFDRTIIKPTGVNRLLGELMRDGTFYLWWNERLAKIPLKAIRPQTEVATLVAEDDFIKGTGEITREPDERMTRPIVYWGIIDPTKSETDPSNYRYQRGIINAGVEGPDAGASIITKQIFSQWISSDAQALELVNRLNARYEYSPRYLKFSAPFSRQYEMADVIRISMRQDLDTEGRRDPKRWQVISRKESPQGVAFSYVVQEFLYQASRYAAWMADDAPAFADATEDDLLTGAWWSDDEGKMADNSSGWLWQ